MNFFPSVGAVLKGNLNAEIPENVETEQIANPQHQNSIYKNNQRFHLNFLIIQPRNIQGENVQGLSWRRYIWIVFSRPK